MRSGFPIPLKQPGFRIIYESYILLCIGHAIEQEIFKLPFRYLTLLPLTTLVPQIIFEEALERWVSQRYFVNTVDSLITELMQTGVSWI